LIKGRNSVKRGPFCLRLAEKGANWALLGWTGFTLMMYSFPPVMLVKVGNMNYVCVVNAVVFTCVVGWWFVKGKRKFKERDELVSQVLRVPFIPRF
jgi:choline transport protein